MDGHTKQKKITPSFFSGFFRSRSPEVLMSLGLENLGFLLFEIPPPSFLSGSWGPYVLRSWSLENFGIAFSMPPPYFPPHPVTQHVTLYSFIGRQLRNLIEKSVMHVKSLLQRDGYFFQWHSGIPHVNFEKSEDLVHWILRFHRVFTAPLTSSRLTGTLRQVGEYVETSSSSEQKTLMKLINHIFHFHIQRI